MTIFESPEPQAQIIWHSEPLHLAADRCQSPAKAIKVVNHLCGGYAKATRVPNQAQCFPLFRVKVPCAANLTKRIPITGHKAWAEWYAAIARQPHADEIKVTFWTHVVVDAKQEDEDGYKKRKLNEDGTLVRASGPKKPEKAFQSKRVADRWLIQSMV